MIIPTCRYHLHPIMVAPIFEDTFRAELDRLYREARAYHPDLPPHSVVFTDQMARIHEDKPRQYAQVTPEEGLFEFAAQVLYLPREHRTGLLAHEIGHVIVGHLGDDHSEDEADSAAETTLDLIIEYDLLWPGKGLQRAIR